MACTDKDAGDVVANAFEIGSEDLSISLLRVVGEFWRVSTSSIRKMRRT